MPLKLAKENLLIPQKDKSSPTLGQRNATLRGSVASLRRRSFCELSNVAAGWPLATLDRRGLRGRQRLHSAGMMPCHDNWGPMTGTVVGFFGFLFDRR